jgi:hypothetical protein
MKPIKCYPIFLICLLFLFSCSNTRFAQNVDYSQQPAAGSGLPQEYLPVFDDIDETAELTEVEVLTVDKKRNRVRNREGFATTKRTKGRKSKVVDNTIVLKLSEILSEAAGKEDNKLVARNLKNAAKQLKRINDKKDGSFFDKLRYRIGSRMLTKHMDEKAVLNSNTADIMAILALTFGLISLISYYGSFLFGIGAIVTGVLALMSNTNRYGMALAGLILGVIGILFWLILLAVVIAVF